MLLEGAGCTVIFSFLSVSDCKLPFSLLTETHLCFILYKSDFMDIVWAGLINSAVIGDFIRSDRANMMWREMMQPSQSRSLSTIQWQFPHSNLLRTVLLGAHQTTCAAVRGWIRKLCRICRKNILSTAVIMSRPAVLQTISLSLKCIPLFKFRLKSEHRSKNLRIKLWN